MPPPVLWDLYPRRLKATTTQWMRLEQPHRLNTRAPYLIPPFTRREWHTLKGATLITLPHLSCFDHFRGVRSWCSLVHKATLCATKPCFGSTDDQSNDHKDKWSNKWSYHKWSTNDHHTAALSTPHYQIGNITDKYQLHNLWARTSHWRVLS